MIPRAFVSALLLHRCPACVARCTPSPKVSFLPSFRFADSRAVECGTDWLAESTLHCIALRPYQSSPDACDKPTDERKYRFSAAARHARLRRCSTLQLWYTTVVHLSREATSRTRQPQSSGLLVSISSPLAGPRISIVWTVHWLRLSIVKLQATH
jgi:hypothetical protein